MGDSTLVVAAFHRAWRVLAAAGSFEEVDGW